MNLIICGLPMSGKTTIGKMVAEKLGWNFIDTDQLIEEAYTLKTGKIASCRQIFMQEGESPFRHLEKQQIAALKERTKSVIALGGGTFDDADNTQAIQLIGCLIYLKAAINILWERRQDRGIPAYLDPINPEKAFHAIAKMRVPIYEALANIVIETNYLSKQAVVDEILLNWYALI